MRTIRIKNPEGEGWITVTFNATMKIGDRVSAVVRIGDTFPRPVEPDQIHPDDYKILVEQAEADNR